MANCYLTRQRLCNKHGRVTESSFPEALAKWINSTTLTMVKFLSSCS